MSSPSKRTPSRACDPCFSQKEKCVFTGDHAACDRCIRLLKKCVSNRPVRRPGRRPLAAPPRARNGPAQGAGSSSVSPSRGSSPSSESALSRSLSPFGGEIAKMNATEQKMVQQFLIISNFKVFMTAPRFASEMHKQAIHSFFNHYDQVSDGYFALYGAFATTVGMEVKGFDTDTNLRRGATALEKWRNWPCPSNRLDFLPWLWLGMTTMVYANCALGINPTTARRYFLDSIARNPSIPTDLCAHPVVMNIAAQDIYDCLIHRQAPALNVPSDVAVGVDTFMGISLPLVRYVFDLCWISCSAGADGLSEERLEELDRLEKVVDVWQPNPPETVEQFPPQDVAQMLSQASVHKMMILLFIHRLKFPFGQEDALATRMARSILDDLERAKIATNRAPRLVMYPFFVAAIEARGDAERQKILEDVAMYVDLLSPTQYDMTKEFLMAIWENRDRSGPFKWIDFMDCLPPIHLSM